jgi:hypothetical protein
MTKQYFQTTHACLQGGAAQEAKDAKRTVDHDRLSTISQDRVRFWIFSMISVLFAATLQADRDRLVATGTGGTRFPFQSVTLRRVANEQQSWRHHRAHGKGERLAEGLSDLAPSFSLSKDYQNTFIRRKASNKNLSLTFVAFTPQLVPVRHAKLANCAVHQSCAHPRVVAKRLDTERHSQSGDLSPPADGWLRSNLAMFPPRAARALSSTSRRFAGAERNCE